MIEKTHPGMIENAVLKLQGKVDKELNIARTHGQAEDVENWQKVSSVVQRMGVLANEELKWEGVSDPKPSRTKERTIVTRPSVPAPGQTLEQYLSLDQTVPAGEPPPPNTALYNSSIRLAAEFADIDVGKDYAFRAKLAKMGFSTPTAKALENAAKRQNVYKPEDLYTLNAQAVVGSSRIGPKAVSEIQSVLGAYRPQLKGKPTG